ncbi:substrate-binding domain-containing protein [Ruania alkalisoli]|uniref:Substrate-binding domain-containing protein n=1 Tax=Ruania alkalisoli TaxID=2779775 RepID=A0A7M1SYI7_9MICO|nr:substrate-binding domain-containing protein [Ruania alkalisoli]QOR71703.1 substrate-binding domain-containing protein [Ruania alkalisoli]
MTPTNRRAAAATLAGVAALALAACTGQASATDQIEISGSSTVAPITEHVARMAGQDVSVTAEGTEDGFARFCAGETAINNASEAIPQEFLDACEAAGVEFIELPIAWDALAVVVHAQNEFADDVTIEELGAIWAPDSSVQTWQDVRPEWPDSELTRYGRPDGSGTFATFTHQVNGEAGQIVEGVQSSDDITELTGWVADDPGAIAFMGIGNYLGSAETRDELTTVSIDGVAPSRERVQDGSYEPLSRPLFIYVSTTALESEDVTGFVEAYLEQAQASAALTFFYALDDELTAAAAQRFEARVTGSVFDGDPFGEVDLLEALTS